MPVAQLLAAGVALYAAAGLLFAGWFVIFAVDRFDASAHGAGAGFRILILPGVAALWPYLLVRWFSKDAV